MINIRIIRLSQAGFSFDPFVCDGPLGPQMRKMQRIIKPPYILSFDVKKCADGTTFNTLLRKLNVSTDSALIHCIRGNAAIDISKNEQRDFLLCDEDIIHITESFSLVKEIACRLL